MICQQKKTVLSQKSPAHLLDLFLRTFFLIRKLYKFFHIPSLLAVPPRDTSLKAAVRTKLHLLAVAWREAEVNILFID